MGTLENYQGLVGTRRNYETASWSGVTVPTNDSVTASIDLEGGESVRASFTMSGSTDWDVDIHYWESESHSVLIKTHNVVATQGADTEVNVDELMAYPYATIEVSNNDGTNAGTLNGTVQVT